MTADQLFPASPAIPTLSAFLAHQLRCNLVSSEQIACLDMAMLASAGSLSASVFAISFDDIYRRFGVLGLAVQIQQLVKNLAKWKGHEADVAKRVLIRWADEIPIKAAKQR